MKNFNNICESILADIENTLDKGEEDIKKVYYNEMLSMFNIDRKVQYDDVISIFDHNNARLSTQAKKDIIDTCCTYDGNVLTINFDELKDGWKYSVIMMIYGKPKRLPIVKVISTKDRIKGKISPNATLSSMISLNIVSDKSIDINDYIHKDTKVESISVSTINGGGKFGLKHNNFNFSPRRVFECNTLIDNIDATKWPKCELKFTKYAQLCIMLQQTNMPMSHMADISRDHVTGNIVI